MTSTETRKPTARPFDSHRRPASEAMDELVYDVMLQLEGYELYHRTRARKRSAKAQATYKETVEAIICDLIHRELEQTGGQVHVSQSNQVLRKKSRYKGRAMGKTLPDVLKVMSAPEMGFVSLIPGTPGFAGEEEGWAYTVKGRQTVMAAGGKLKSRISTFGITFADIGGSPEEEIIILRGKKKRADKPGALVEYKDSDETCLVRQQLREVNEWLQQASIECDEPTIDLHDRRLRRIFNNSDFQQGGRLYGGFWQGMSGDERLGTLIIDDDSAVELDYGQMGLMLLYGLEQAAPPAGDLYDLTEHGIPVSCRPGIKKVIQAAINASNPLDRMPKGARKTIPKRYSLSEIMEAVHLRHPDVSHCFGSGIGMRLMRQESDILVKALLTLKEQNITALPVHDAILVNANHEGEARSVMVQVFQEHTGLVPEISSHHP